MPESDDSLATLAGSVLLVEDDAAVRSSLALLLRLHGLRTEEFGSAEEFLGATVNERPACALLDIRLPGMSGLALQARIVRENRGLPVLLMTALADAEIARTALLQGAIDFLEKPIDEGELLEAVAVALRCDRDQMARSRERDAVLARVGSLTRRERDLFERITDGRQSREIAEEFGLSLAALEAQRLQMMEKLQVRRVADLLRLRFRIGECVSGQRAVF
jgi:FixJ family two-component response regulator